MADQHPAPPIPSALVPPTWSAHLPQPDRAEHIRLSFRRFLIGHAGPDSDVDAAESIVAELVANVVRHGGGYASLDFDWGDSHATLAVVDSGPGFHMTPKSSLTDLGAECGRGLAIVEALALNFEYGNRSEGGAYVRVTLPVRRP